jgi:hypothetical protein
LRHFRKTLRHFGGSLAYKKHKTLRSIKPFSIFARRYRLGDIQHHEGFSLVKIEAKEDGITPSDIFWLGHFSAGWKIDN